MNDSTPVKLPRSADLAARTALKIGYTPKRPELANNVSENRAFCYDMWTSPQKGEVLLISDKPTSEDIVGYLEIFEKYKPNESLEPIWRFFCDGLSCLEMSRKLRRPFSEVRMKLDKVLKDAVKWSEV